MSDTTTDTETGRESEAEYITGEPAHVEWVGGLGNEWTVEVDPYAGTVTVNGEEFDVSELEDGRPILAPPEQVVGDG